MYLRRQSYVRMVKEKYEMTLSDNIKLCYFIFKIIIYYSIRIDIIIFILKLFNNFRSIEGFERKVMNEEVNKSIGVPAKPLNENKTFLRIKLLSEINIMSFLFKKWTLSVM